jgi:hypothetical protein
MLLLALAARLRGAHLRRQTPLPRGRCLPARSFSRPKEFREQETAHCSMYGRWVSFDSKPRKAQAALADLVERTVLRE